MLSPPTERDRSRSSPSDARRLAPLALALPNPLLPPPPPPPLGPGLAARLSSTLKPQTEGSSPQAARPPFRSALLLPAQGRSGDAAGNGSELPSSYSPQGSRMRICSGEGYFSPSRSRAKRSRRSGDFKRATSPRSSSF